MLEEGGEDAWRDQEEGQTCGNCVCRRLGFADHGLVT